MRGLMILIASIGFVSAMTGGMMSRSPVPRDGEPTLVAAHEQSSEPADSTGYESDTEDGAVRLERKSDGHFYADVRINGAPVHALIDTGASGIALSRNDARSAGLATSIGMPSIVGRGADGDVHGEYVTLDRVSLGHKSAEMMRAVVLNAGEQSLLGQSFLSKFESVEIRGDTMVLR